MNTAASAASPLIAQTVVEVDNVISIQTARIQISFAYWALGLGDDFPYR
jgi:hypothetical protein